MLMWLQAVVGGVITRLREAPGAGAANLPGADLVADAFEADAFEEEFPCN
jgi:hypothetical protein